MRKRFFIADAFRAATTVAALGLCALSLHGQAVAPKSAAEGKPATKEQAKADSNKLPAERGDVVDRIVAIVNGDLVLESDVEVEERFTKLYPYSTDSSKPLREQAITRLIDRSLIEQQQAGYPMTPVTDEQIKKDEADLRKDLPACAHADCTSNAGWKDFLTKVGFTQEELRERLRERESVLHFIEQRFRNGVRITDKQIEDFYNNTMLPEYAKQKATAPPLDSVRDRIEEVLLQQEVSSLLDQWLKTLRDSGHVRMMQKGVEAP
ncbi:SurA-like protein [Terriglobus roseus DSM 18391]|uniref:SurA-like protein n=1 Tax=Terriglobus roseus (strain DSM 18391 / NRRL B-41598 / KBS 63) TaxID=926566 RepID=I3ZJN8_TERRK|nr:peptidylprolyl isomerase [Terriglobus roseus]AFL89456.1 SurA-like protein [Terriglobus roseus DSM 18391]